MSELLYFLGGGAVGVVMTLLTEAYLMTKREKAASAKKKRGRKPSAEPDIKVDSSMYGRKGNGIDKEAS